jgi:hypothetical protein
MFKLFVIAFALMSTPAYAGKLSQGVFGIPWGEHTEFPQPAETSNCIQKVDVGVEWTCDKLIGETPVVVSYAWKHQRFYAIILNGQGFTNCDQLMKVLTAAWGNSKPQSEYLRGDMDDRIWFDGQATATWKYNKYSDKCTATAVNTAQYTAVQRQDREAAKNVSNGI